MRITFLLFFLILLSSVAFAIGEPIDPTLPGPEQLDGEPGSTPPSNPCAEHEAHGLPCSGDSDSQGGGGSGPFPYDEPEGYPGGGFGDPHWDPPGWDPTHSVF